MSRKECCLWSAEITDDALKQMFQSEESYANGNKVKAIEYLNSQIDRRLPIIEANAKKKCGNLRYNPTKMLQADLRAIEMMMLGNAPKSNVHKEVMRIDKKYASKGYIAFAKCMR